MIESGSYGDPPRTRRKDYSHVLLQLLSRMRYDLLLLLVVTGLVMGGLIPRGWVENDEIVRILGIAVSIFIGFRNTQAISRWWEARKLWGTMVNQSRNWADSLAAYLPVSTQGRRWTTRLVRLQVAIVWQLNFQLRNSWHRDLRSLQTELLQALRLPDTTNLRQLGRQRGLWLQRLHAEGLLDGWGRHQLVEVGNACTDAIGGLERIRNTPLPASYDVFVRIINWVFGIQLLLSFHYQDGGRFSSFNGFMIMLCFLMAERIGAYVEGPFDADGSSFSLPLNSICLSISRDLLESEADHVLHLQSQDPVRWT
jgi:putative membrane protein